MKIAFAKTIVINMTIHTKITVININSIENLVISDNQYSCKYLTLFIIKI